MKRLSSIIMNVATPVYVEKSPMNEEYSFGLGNCTNPKTHSISSIQTHKGDTHSPSDNITYNHGFDSVRVLGRCYIFYPSLLYRKVGLEKYLLAPA
jgi:hypothetical protein